MATSDDLYERLQPLDWLTFEELGAKHAKPITGAIPTPLPTPVPPSPRTFSILYLRSTIAPGANVCMGGIVVRFEQLALIWR